MTHVPRTAISILTIGDELLSGEIADTNFPFIASELSAVGLRVSMHLTVGDDEESIAEAVRGLVRDSGAVILTGGLGPTADDLTREGVAAATSTDLVFHEHLAVMIRGFFERLGRSMPEENLCQAHLPYGAMEIPPAGGTAPGFILESDGALIFALPGVPMEMRDMLRSHVLPELDKRFAGSRVTVSRSIMTFGAGESSVAEKVSDIAGKGPIRYGFLVSGGPVTVKLQAVAASTEDASAILDEEQRKVLERLGLLVFSVNGESMEEVVGRLLVEKGMTVSTAESLTAGMVASMIANVPGSSRYLLGGVVAYGMEEKRKVLCIPGEALAEGAVNRRVAELMAESARSMFSSDIGISTTGVAGPDTGPESKPVGTVCAALAHEGGTDSLEVRLPGGRALVRRIASLGVLNALRLHLISDECTPDA